MKPQDTEQNRDGAEGPLSFTGYRLRELPVPAGAYHLPGEVAAWMDRCERRLRSQRESHVSEMQALTHAMARLTQFVFHLEQAIQAAESASGGAGLDRELRRMRILKDQMKTHLLSHGLTWRDPAGEVMTEELEACVEVDRWQYSGTIDAETVIEVREPVILASGNVILRGNVVVAAPGGE